MDLLKTWQMHEVAENILLEKTKKCMDLYSSTFKWVNNTRFISDNKITQNDSVIASFFPLKVFFWLFSLADTYSTKVERAKKKSTLLIKLW